LTELGCYLIYFWTDNLPYLAFLTKTITMRIRLSFFLGLFFFAGFAISLFAQAQNYIGDKKHYFGTAYYPESWDLADVDQDVVRMKELNMSVMRMAEFAWSSMEPTEGDYQFGWLHQVIDKLHSNGIHVILGTPTATPPAWLAHKHPEIFIVAEDGTSKTHGARRNCSYTSEVYREYSRKIIRAMAKEFGRKPGVIGWQTDNEFGYYPDFSEETRIRWHQWLQERYQSIDAINRLWGTQLWSQTYNSFDQIPLPKSTVWHNPSLQLAWQRFNNDMIVEYQDIHLEAIREFSDFPVTHDGMPGQRIDYEKLFKDLDFMAFNVYHGWQAYNRIQSNYDRVRSYGKGFHWLFETAPNSSGGGPQGQTWFIHQPDGAMRANIWMNHAMGGQGSMYWLWKQHWAGHEMPHGSVISSWNQPAANYKDIMNLGKELRATSDILMNAPVEKAEMAIFYCHSNSHMLSVENYSNNLSYYTDWTNMFYRPVADAFFHRDVIHQGIDISDYKMLLMPLLPMIRDDLKQKIMQWVENGGVLIMGPMSGYRTEEWTSFTNYSKGDWEPWMGITVQSRIPIDAHNSLGTIPLMLKFDDRTELPASEAGLWSEAMNSANGKTLATYEGGMHKGLPAIMENKVGKGKVIMLGTYPGYEAYQWLIKHYAEEAGIRPLATGDKDVVVVPREGNIRIIINLTNDLKKLSMGRKSGEDILTKQKVRLSDVQLKPYDVKILRVD
jgi:beta-galactosidase